MGMHIMFYFFAFVHFFFILNISLALFRYDACAILVDEENDEYASHYNQREIIR